MRLALLTNFVPPYRLPVYRALRDRAGELRIFISTAMEKGRPWQPRWEDLDVVVQKSWSVQRTWRHERFSQPIEMHLPYDTILQLRHWRPDAVITAEFGLRTIQAIAYARAARVPVVVWATLSEHMEAGRGALRTAVRRMIVRSADRILVNGENGARYIRSLGAPDAKAVRVAQAIELAPFVALPLARDQRTARRLICVGNVTQLKGVDLLIEGLAIRARCCPNQALALTIVGDGPLRAPLQRVTLPANLEVEWRSAVDYHELPSVYATAGLLIFPTQGDEWGLVVNEAMAAGLPVIGSIFSQAVEELVEDGRNGWRFEPSSAQAVADAVGRALAVPDEELDAMRARARQVAMQITPDTVAERIMEVLDEIRSE